MIKIDNGIFYLSAGETCYIFKSDEGRLKHLYFGKRVEPEDDISALGGGTPADEISISAQLGNRKLVTDFVPDTACTEVLEQKPNGGLTLGGGKTLKLVLRDVKNSLSAELYYTPYPRGGYTRRVVIRNDGERTIKSIFKISSTFAKRSPLLLTADGAFVSDLPNGKAVKGDRAENDGQRRMRNFAALSNGRAGELHGEVYGFLCAYGDGEIECSGSGAKTVVTCCADAKELAPGETVELPEVLAVYSDLGHGGMTRIFHDILREKMCGENERGFTVLFLPQMTEKKACAAAQAAYELGFDVIAVDAAGFTNPQLGEISAVCKDVGINFGLRVRTAVDDISAAAAEVERLLAENDVHYIMLDILGTGADGGNATRLFAIRRVLQPDHADIKFECGVVAEGRRSDLSVCYPPCLIRNVISPMPPESFKLRFDLATMGMLGYEFDPAALQGGTKHAVRAQILSYQDDAPTVMRGDVYKPNDGSDGVCKMSVTKDKSKAYAVCVADRLSNSVHLIGLDEHNLYHVRELGKTFSGAALAYCGVALPAANVAAEKSSFTLHLQQVADYE